LVHRVLAGSTSIDAQRLGLSLAGLPRFFAEAAEYRIKARGSRFPFRFENLYPITADRHQAGGIASGHYFHQDLWAARKIFERRPERHVDVASRVDGFIAHLLVFMPVEILDIRTIQSDVVGLRFVQGDGATLDGFEDSSLDSVSSLHALEHFGLGRYGDPIDARACFQAMSAFARVLRPGGRLYMGVPIGRERVEFNAHRVFAPATVLEGFRSLELLSFSAVDDKGKLRENGEPSDFAGARYACGLFEFTKR
jgi:SAM-dependent methyltransferase